MIAQSTIQPKVDVQPLAFFQQAWRSHRLLTLATLLHILLIPLFILAWLVDPKVITGAPAWIKPLKFALSGGVYLFTFAWLLGYVTRYPRTARWAATITGFALLVETTLIAVQVLRGTTSHFNNTTPLDSAIFQIMGMFIVAVAVLNLFLAIWLLREKLPDPVFAWGLRFGVLLAFVGMGVAFLMTSMPSPVQLAERQATGEFAQFGAHSVGVEDGGPGLPLVGWSTVGGDLRIPHFVGLHAMQVLPLAGWLLTRRNARQRWGEGQRCGLIGITGFGYLGLIVLLTWQALRGQSIIAPDGLTLAAFGGLGALLLAAVAVVNFANQKGK